MPHGVCEKPQRRTAFAFSSEERLSGPFPRTAASRYVRRTTLTPQYMASSWACVSPAVEVAPAHAVATACRADESAACGVAAAVGAVKPRAIAVRAWATPIARSGQLIPFRAGTCTFLP